MTYFAMNSTLFLRATKNTSLIQFEGPFRAFCMWKQSLQLKILPRSCVNLHLSSSSHQQSDPMPQSHSPICLACLLPMSNLSLSLLPGKCESSDCHGVSHHQLAAMAASYTLHVTLLVQTCDHTVDSHPPPRFVDSPFLQT